MWRWRVLLHELGIPIHSGLRRTDLESEHSRAETPTIHTVLQEEPGRHQSLHHQVGPAAEYWRPGLHHAAQLRRWGCGGFPVLLHRSDPDVQQGLSAAVQHMLLCVHTKPEGTTRFHTKSTETRIKANFP